MGGINSKSSGVTVTEEKLDVSIFQQSILNGEVLGIGVCHLNPSGCLDFTERFSSQLHIPFVRVQYFQDPFIHKSKYKFHDDIPKYNTKCNTVFFTGCGLSLYLMSSILQFFFEDKRFTNIKYVYEISPPQYSYGERMTMEVFQDSRKARFFKNSRYKYGLLYSSVNPDFPSNIGIPRFPLISSQFEVPAECYGVMRYRHTADFIAEKNGQYLTKAVAYFNEYFRQVTDAGKDCTIKPLSVIALGIEAGTRGLIKKIAQQYSIQVDFCEHLPNLRLPKQDYLKLLSVMKDKKGIVSFEDTSILSLLQAINFETFVMIYARCSAHYLLKLFYLGLIKLVEKDYQPVAEVIFGLNSNYTLFKNKEHCQKVYSMLHTKLDETHQLFENLKRTCTTQVEEKHVQPTFG